MTALPYPMPSSQAVSAAMKGNHKAGTRPERRLRSALHRRGHRFRVLLPLTIEGVRVRPDIVFTRRRLAVFVDGCFWHSCPDHGTAPRVNLDYWRPKLERNQARDRRVDEALTRAGWSVVRVWEHVGIEAAVAVVEARIEKPNGTT